MLPKSSNQKIWPLGPSTGLTGWGLFRRMSKNMLVTLSQWQQQFGPIFHIRVWPEHIVVVCDPKMARELLVTHHHKLIRWERGIHAFAKIHGNSVLIAEGDQWAQKRHALQPYFKPQSLRNTTEVIINVIQSGLHQWPSNNIHWNIESAITALTMDAIMQALFSHRIKEDNRKAEQAVQDASQAMNAEFFTIASWPNWMLKKKKKAIQFLNELIDQHINTRLKTPENNWPEDYLSYLLQLKQTEPDKWTREAVRDECMTMFLAGHETTAATLTWWAWSMAKNPEYQEKARNEISRVLQGKIPTHDQLSELHYLTQTLEETMRLYPAAPLLMTRRATEALTLGEWEFPKRTLFMIPLQLMQRDKKCHHAPQKYDADRFNQDNKSRSRGAYAPFGMGQRVCLGQNLATAEMRVIAAMILQRWMLSIPSGMQAPTPTLNVTLRPDTPLHLALTPCYPSDF